VASAGVAVRVVVAWVVTTPGVRASILAYIVAGMV
jgi:hypothetical protein